jgi:signal transduction histidine kinase/ligand-binding sensor domain-containing protein
VLEQPAYRHYRSRSIIDVQALNGADVLFYRQDSIFLLNYAEGTIDLLAVSNTALTYCLPTPDGSILFGSEKGVFRLHEKPGGWVFEPVFPQVAGRHVRVLSFDWFGSLLVGTYRNGLYRISIADSAVVQYTEHQNLHYISDNWVEDIHIDGTGMMWVATDDGLNMATKPVDESALPVFTLLPSAESDPYGLAANNIRTIYEDKVGNLWFGSLKHGLSIHYKDRLLVDHFKHFPHSPHAPAGKSITDFAEDYKGNIWMAVDGQGLSMLNTGTGHLEHYLYANRQYNLPGAKVIKLDTDSLGKKIYGVTYGDGAFVFDVDAKKAQKLPIDHRHQESAYTFRVQVDEQGMVWIGLMDEGLTMYNPRTGKYISYKAQIQAINALNSPSVDFLFIDNSGRVWISTHQTGLLLVEPESETVTARHVLSSIYPKNFQQVYMRQAAQDTEGNFWFLCEQKLVYLSPSREAFKEFALRHTINANEAYSMVCLRDTLWIASSRGLERIAYTIKDNLPELSITPIGTAHGAMQPPYSNTAAFASSAGLIYFGGNDGFNVVNTNRIQHSGAVSGVHFTNFTLYQQDAAHHLDTTAMHKKSIRLQHDQNSFNIDYVGIHLSNPKTLRYEYLLEGFEKDWQLAGTKRTASYTNLNPGRYKFRVRTYMEHNPDEHTEASVLIIIVPAFWQTLWFKFAILLLAIAVALSAYYYRVNTIKRQRRKLELLVTERTAELQRVLRTLQEQSEEIQAQNEELTAQNDEINLQREQIEIINRELEEKVNERTSSLIKANEELDRFVYSASHDLSAPLKSIVGLVHVARVEDTENRFGIHYDHIERSVNRLEEVIKDLTQFSRNKGLPLKPRKILLKELLKEVMMEQQNLQVQQPVLRYQFDDDTAFCTDFYRMKIIISNLVSNALKYHDPEKHHLIMEIGYKREGKGHQLIISDNGIGIAQDQLKKIFDMFYRATTASHGSGLGLYIVREMLHKLRGSIEVKSQEAQGTTFTLRFPEM